ncbi:HAD-IA family hydrolase [Cohaesibacter celericrescens]|uniref:Haloacid dehalogenase n=1 Tax=Cohaesibacter celericrescens TaxID=2067669 RepID=A0A2N5XVB5_9HYPH|nr:HAD-IA family hydrolase [Cohaesibacter celericrescens]PLW78434.1 haloacid dehalogenase [Cohaesibacter celericrescens]
MQRLDLDRVECLIFDLDGTLVDSEILSQQAYCDTVPDLDWDVHHLMTHFRGHQFSRIVHALEEHVGRKLPEDYEALYRARVAELFETQLKAYPHVTEAILGIKLPKCIASSGPLKKMRHSLGLTGLAQYFEPHLFSAYEISSWKPDPDLFLHAAKAMGFEPQACLVIEDSAVGIQAAQAADMQFLLHCPKGHDLPTGYDGPVLEDYSDFPLSVSQ